MKLFPDQLLIGWRETVSMPDLGLERFRAKIDTGALTTALHASNIRRRTVEGRDWVEFLPDHELLSDIEPCRAPILHTRNITNTSGVPEQRFIIATPLQIGPRKVRIEVSLTDRSDMTYPIIIGRSALRLLQMTVDPSRSWLQSRKKLGRRERERQ